MAPPVGTYALSLLLHFLQLLGALSASFLCSGYCQQAGLRVHAKRTSCRVGLCTGKHVYSHLTGGMSALQTCQQEAKVDVTIGPVQSVERVEGMDLYVFQTMSFLSEREPGEFRLMFHK